MWGTDQSNNRIGANEYGYSRNCSKRTNFNRIYADQVRGRTDGKSLFLLLQAFEECTGLRWNSQNIGRVITASRMMTRVLLGTSAASGGSIGLLVSALSLQLLFGLWIFTRLLIYRN